jgi:hypothetical protein
LVQRLHWRFGLARRSRIVRVYFHKSRVSPLTERSDTSTLSGEATDVSSSAMFGGRTVGVLREIFFFWRAVWLGLGGI